MRLIKTINAALITLGVCLAVPAGAAPAGSIPQSAIPEGNNLVIQVQQDCHRDVRRHYLPRYGERVWHYHRPSCRVVVVDPPRDERPRDCHRDVRRHYIPEYGRQVTHRHVGESCRVRELRRTDGNYGNGGSCIRIGPILYCEN
jgi:hypothetical protein